jgi:hypothetical protein
MASAKNFMLSPAATDLGLGDSLKDQLDAEEIERRKKLGQQAENVNKGGIGQAVGMLFPGYGN